MNSDIRAAAEYNSDGCIVYAVDFIGAYARGLTLDEALAKLPADVSRYCRWLDISASAIDCKPVIIEQKHSELKVCDADSDIIFESERTPLTQTEYEHLKKLALRSASDFLTLYNSIPNKSGSVLSPRTTFYGAVPVTADEMYLHTKSVNAYYFAEIGVDASNEPDILTCRQQAFSVLESQPDYLANTIFDGSYGEQWSLRKLCRRFIWHDRIHARAMYRMAVRLCGKSEICDTFKFGDAAD